MARVRSISNHPYNGQMRTKGCEYEAAAADVDLLVSLGRVVALTEQSDRRAYETRELHASPPSAANIRSRRRSVPASAVAESSTPRPADET